MSVVDEVLRVLQHICLFFSKPSPAELDHKLFFVYSTTDSLLKITTEAMCKTICFPTVEQNTNYTVDMLCDNF